MLSFISTPALVLGHGRTYTSWKKLYTIYFLSKCQFTPGKNLFFFFFLLTFGRGTFGNSIAAVISNGSLV